MKKLSSVMIALLSSTLLSVPAWADDSHEISSDYLNGLTPKVTWEEVSSEGDNTVKVGDKVFQYTYNKPGNYSEVADKTSSATTSAAGTSGAYVIHGNNNPDLINNPSGTTIQANDPTVNNVLYQNNSLDGTLKHRYNIIGGSAIINQGEIEAINADFVGNSTNTIFSISGGFTTGAVTNIAGGTIGNIVGDFVSNNVQGTTSGSATSSYSYGGAIYNNASTIGDITGDFVSNYAKTYGGAIYNYNNGVLGNITGNFIGNSASEGGVFYSHTDSSFGDITGDFIGNHAQSEGAAAGGVFISWNTTYGDIHGNFIGNYVSSSGSSTAEGGVIHAGLHNQYGDIFGDFIGNYAKSSWSTEGGAIDAASDVTFGNITGNFIGNYVETGEYGFAEGGAIRASSSKFGDITGNFTNNHAYSRDGYAYGGAIDGGTFGNITGDFINNYVHGAATVRGGAIAEVGTFGNILGNFIGNYAETTSSYYYGGYAYGGAIDVYWGAGDNISGDFIENHASAIDGYAYGGAIYNPYGTITNIVNSNFTNNYVEGNVVYGGAIHNSGIIGNITGDFSNNYALGKDETFGGAISNGSNSYMDERLYNLYDSVDQDTPSYAIELWDMGSEASIISTDLSFNENTFSGNYAQSDEGNAYGGAIANSISVTSDYRVYDEVSSDDYGMTTRERYEELSEYPNSPQEFFDEYEISSTLNLTNTNFLNNHVEAAGRALGGAIYSNQDVNIIADNGTSLFDGNTANGKSNAIYMTKQMKLQRYHHNSGEDTTEIVYIDSANPTLNLSAVNNGTITFNDGIDGEGYNINISGDGTGVVKFNNLVEHVTNFTLGANSITHLGVNSKVYAEHMNVSSSAIIIPGAVSSSSPIITVDVEVDKANNIVNTGQIYVDNDIEGDYRVLVNSLNPDVLDNLDDAIVPFLFAPEDNTDTSSSFSIARVIGSPYMWDGSVNAKGEDTGSTWYLNLTEEENPDYVPPEPEPTPGKIYAPEVIAGIGLHEAAIEQTRSVVSNVRNKTSGAREYCDNCSGMYSYEWDGKKLRNIWVLAQGESANIDKPVDMEAKIWGIEGGFDIQNDLHNTLGVFASYRKGQYDLSGKGSKLHSNIGSEIDINSYLAGLYYRYDKNFNWLFATVYGGMQEAEVETEDHIAKFDTDGIEFGASIEIGRTIPLANDLTLDPSVGLYYTQVNFDDADDNVGKHYEWEDIKHLEAELGAKLEKQFDNAKVYIKPSVIRTLTKDDSVLITGLNKADTYSDQTLGRIEVGGRYGFTDALSIYAWANYTFGSSYDAYALGAGLNYAW